MNVWDWIVRMHERYLYVPDGRPKHVARNTYGIDYAHPEKYLESGPQTALSDDTFATITPHFHDRAAELDTVKAFYQWKNTAFTRVKGGGRYIGTQSIQDILQAMRITGCHAHGLILVAVARKCGIPAVFVDTVSIEWAKQYREYTAASFQGHVFVEYFLHGRWMLFDSVPGAYVSHYDPQNPIIFPTNRGPEGYYVLYKGLEPRVVRRTLRQLFRQYARMIKAEHQTFQYPQYVINHV